MKLSTHNQLPGTITELVRVEVAPKLTLRAGANHLITLITRESADELSLEAG
ncbi:MAG TPA: TOBE domain-containing protein [Rubrobacteraceae bacterium]|nr:TOBE domain-containing protein [Rubrobacteraceae bacterium]